MNKIIMVMTYLLALLVAVTVGFSGCSESSPTPIKIPTATPIVIETPEPTINIKHKSLGITTKAFNVIQDGMTYEDVCKIIGSPGLLGSTTGSTTLYVWALSNGGGITIVFTDNKVRSKTGSLLEF